MKYFLYEKIKIGRLRNIFAICCLCFLTITLQASVKTKSHKRWFSLPLLSSRKKEKIRKQWLSLNELFSVIKAKTRKAWFSLSSLFSRKKKKVRKKWFSPRSFLFRRKKTAFVFAPGVLHDDSYLIQLCKRYTTVAGAPLSSKTGFEVVDTTYCTSCIFPEIILPTSMHSVKRQPVVANGVLPKLFYRFGTWVRSRRTKKKYGPEPNPVIKQFGIDLTRLNIAQEPDIDALMHTYLDYVTNTKVHNVVLYGFSRGAATTFKYVATKYKMHTGGQQKVQAVVLQGCFDSMTGTLTGSKFNINKFLSRMLPSYTENRIEPIDVVKDFPHSIPVLFITSVADEVVPAESTKRLAYALRDVGHPAVYLLELMNSPHSRYTSYHQDDIQKVEQAVHAFYARYGVVHIPYLAKAGRLLLDKISMS